MSDPIEQYRQEWVDAGRPYPLEVSKDYLSQWEVLWHDSLWDGRGGCSSPIAEFSTWEEAMAFVEEQWHLSTVYRIGRDSIVGPMPPTYAEQQLFGIESWPPL